MSAENKKLTTPLGKTLELKPFLTAREYRRVRSVYVDALKTEVTGGQMTPVANFTGAVVDEAENRLIETVVVSYDGSNENILERLLDQPAGELSFVAEECNKISNGNLTETK